MEHLEDERNAVGRAVGETASRQTETVRMAPLGELTAPKIDQGGPVGTDDFAYVDISSVDNKLKRITEPKALAAEAAPSRAKQRLKSGDVLVSMTRPNLNAVAIVPPELDGAVGSTGFYVLRANEGTEPRWLYYAVQTQDFVSAMSELVQGALYPAVRPKDIRAFEIPHRPLDQQKRIVAEIEKQFSRLDEAVANLKRVKTNLKRYKAAVLKAAVEGRLVETEAEIARREGRSYETGAQLLQRILETRRSQWKGKGKYKEPAAPDTTDVPELPEGWVWTSLDQLSDVVRGGSPRPAGDPRYFGGPVPWITVGLLTGDESDYLHRVPEGLTLEGKERSRYIEPDTLLLTNSGATLGVPKISLIGGCINDGVAALLGVEYPLKRYLVNFLRTKTMSMRRINQGASQPNLNTSIIKAMVVPLPLEAEQHRIVAEVDRRLSLLSETEAQVDANLQRAEHLRQAVLASAFRGQLERQGHNHGNRSKTTE